MLHLPANSLKIMKAKRSFHKGMFDFILKRIDKIDNIRNINNEIMKTIFSNLINDNIDDILIGTPDKLIEVNKQLAPFVTFYPDLRIGIEYVFNYDLFITKAKNRYDAYDLAESLDINTCTYCNRNYTSTVITEGGEKLVRPQFDHYFDKGTNPLLAVSFYNLIPCCSICNSSIKGTAKFNLDDHLHPYFDNKISDIRFTYEYSNSSKSGLKIKIITQNPSKEKNTVEAFALEQIYNSHIGELLNLIKTRQYFSDRYLSILTSNLLRGVHISREDLYGIIFGAEYDSINFINRPFSKFKYDILKELGII
ncbi:hypothetical protein FAES_3369 [Fibrella aestuarina BUZ 2]|uniref:HNH domain-containing protein n=1 Tax=Fibrella aestuarina BUZ 2 TaxID=1166018 RepID=I0KB74_9BACT|nr:hypothetical protein [Fibrella aestuarina]CCH01377.1 hypothetical protein FAES_3369 [Fibrella aestuarina BUZ 2]